MFKSIFEESKPQNISTTGSYFIKGIIHFITDDSFEVLVDEFFSSYLEHNGNFANQDDHCIDLKNDLQYNDDITPKEGEVYGVLWEFQLKYYQDYYGEYDFDIHTIDTKFNLFDTKHTDWILNDPSFQFEE